MRKNGQGSLEYLLLIGGVAVVILVITVILFSLEGDTENAVDDTWEAFKKIIGGLDSQEQAGPDLGNASFAADKDNVQAPPRTI